jgi:hypothetical protein
MFPSGIQPKSSHKSVVGYARKALIYSLNNSCDDYQTTCFGGFQSIRMNKNQIRFILVDSEKDTRSFNIFLAVGFLIVLLLLVLFFMVL